MIRKSRLFVIILSAITVYMISVAFNPGNPELPEDIPMTMYELKQKTIFNGTLVHNECGLNCTVVFTPKLAKRQVVHKWEMSRIPSNYPFLVPIGTELHINNDSFQPPNATIESELIKDDKFYREHAIFQHLDRRYAHKLPAPERRQALTNLFRAWAIFADSKQFPYWIMHGSLLGWYWGGKTMSFDDDIDVQVHANTLYSFSEAPVQVFGRYRFELNPHFRIRSPQHNNKIDARFVDTKNGHFIDITGIALVNETIACKSPHRYQIQDIFPLVRTSFEGVPTWRPFNVSRVLQQEYKKWNVPKHGRYWFSETSGEWIPQYGRRKKIH
ncbi:hypothetical protein HDV01_002541 [Terramyces sp. JEL0728]|nr:hypothetical protein HDV01_002541 [Terramyces sp. JEL0728]